VERTLTVTRHAADEIKRRDYVELLREPDLSVVVFRRIGWTPQQYGIWSDRLLAANFAFVVPTTHDGETVTRFAVVNPITSESDINAILDTMA
jgi:L-2,4-diaminobutyrate decarboxylase